MQTRFIVVVVVAAILALALGGCRAKPSASAATTTTSSSTVLPTPSTAAPPPPTTSAPAGGKRLPISVGAGLSSAGQDPSILVPSTCILQNGNLQAEGTFRDEFVQETYVRYGDVVELYAYTSSSASGGQRVQVAQLAAEQPYRMAGKGPWKVSVPVEIQLGSPVECLIAVQSTHAFMAAGNAGG